MSVVASRRAWSGFAIAAAISASVFPWRSSSALDDLVDRVRDRGLELLGRIEGLLGLLLELGCLRLGSIHEQVRLCDGVFHRSLGPLEVGEEALDPVERLRDDVGGVA